MRKSVVTFWWMPEDERAFLEFVCARFEIVAFTAPWKKRREDVVPHDFASFVAGGSEEKLMFGRSDQMRGQIVEAHDFPRSGVLYNVRCESSCLLWFTGDSRRSDGKLTLRTIGAYWDIFDPAAGTVTPKAEDFQKWGRSIIRWVRRRTPEKEGHYRASLLVKRALLSGSVQVATY